MRVRHFLNRNRYLLRVGIFITLALFLFGIALWLVSAIPKEENSHRLTIREHLSSCVTGKPECVEGILLDSKENDYKIYCDLDSDGAMSLDTIRHHLEQNLSFFDTYTYIPPYQPGECRGGL